MANDVVIMVKGRDAGAKQTLRDAAKAATGMADSTSKIGDAARGILAAGVIQDIGRKAVQFLGQAAAAASNLGESVNAVSVVFGDQSDRVLKWGQDNASAFGLSERAFNQAITPMGAVLKNAGMAMQDVSTNTIDLAKRAADMASVFNTDVTVALDAIGSGLRGETEPLRQFGVTLTAAAVEARALADSGKESAAALTEQEKAAARVAIILEQTDAVAGDFANTSDSMANAQRIATAEWENAQAALGQVLLPIMAGAAQAAASLASGIADLPGPLRTTVGIVVILSAGFLALAPRIMAARAALIVFTGSATAANRALGAVGLVLAALAAAYAATTGETIKAKVEMTGLAEDVTRLNDTGRVGTELWALFGDGVTGAADNTDFFGSKLDLATRKSSSFAAKGEEIINVLGTTGNVMQDAAERFEALDTAMAEAVASGADHEAMLQSIIDAYDLTDEQVAQLVALLPEYETAVERAGEATRIGGDAHRDAAGAAHEQRVELEDLEETLRAQADPMFALIKAQQDLKDAQEAHTQAVEEFGDGSPEAERALLDMFDASLKMSGAAAGAAGTFTGRLTPAMRSMMEAAGLTEREIRDIEKAFDRARRQGEKFARNYNANVNVHTTYTQSGSPSSNFGPGSRGAFAHGGIVGAQAGGPRSGMVLVGEQGPELVDLAPGSTVIPAGATRTMLNNGSNGQAQPVVLVIRSDGNRVSELVKEIVRHSVRVDTSFRGDLSDALAVQ